MNTKPKYLLIHCAALIAVCLLVGILAVTDIGRMVLQLTGAGTVGWLASDAAGKRWPLRN
jgi:hypothetical protein